MKMQYGKVDRIDKPVSRIVEGSMVLDLEDVDASMALLDALFELADTHRRFREFQAVAEVLGLVPSGADPHLEPAVRDHVDVRCDLGEIGRVAVRVARAHLSKPDGARRRGERCHECPRLVARLLGRDRERVEVVEDPRRLVAERLDEEEPQGCDDSTTRAWLVAELVYEVDHEVLDLTLGDPVRRAPIVLGQPGDPLQVGALGDGGEIA